MPIWLSIHPASGRKSPTEVVCKIWELRESIIIVLEPVYVGGAKRRYKPPTGRASRRQTKIVKYRRCKKLKTKSIRSRSGGGPRESGPVAENDCRLSV